MRESTFKVRAQCCLETHLEEKKPYQQVVQTKLFSIYEKFKIFTRKLKNISTKYF